MDNRRRSFVRQSGQDQSGEVKLRRRSSVNIAQVEGRAGLQRPIKSKNKLWEASVQANQRDAELQGFGERKLSTTLDREMERVKLMETSDSEIQELFNLMDVNKDQKLAPKELDCILRALGINATEADLIEFIGELEEGQDKDCVTYEQFAESIKKNMSLTNETDSLQVTFNAFDHAGDGFINSDKLKSVLSNLGLQFQDGDIQAIINNVGADGRISFDQFQHFMLNNDEVI